MTTIRARQHELTNPTCWCHPLVLMPRGSYIVVDGQTVTVDPVHVHFPPPMHPFLSWVPMVGYAHQDVIGAALGCIPGAALWHAQTGGA